MKVVPKLTGLCWATKFYTLLNYLSRSFPLSFQCSLIALSRLLSATVPNSLKATDGRDGRDKHGERLNGGGTSVTACIMVDETFDI